MTNIVVVQFSDNVQTSRDKRFNLTCLFRGPAEAVVTSNYIGAGWDFYYNSPYLSKKRKMYTYLLNKSSQYLKLLFS